MILSGHIKNKENTNILRIYDVVVWKTMTNRYLNVQSFSGI